MKGQWQIYTRSAAEPRSLLKVRGSDPRASRWGRACARARVRGCVFQLHTGAEVLTGSLKGPNGRLML